MFNILEEPTVLTPLLNTPTLAPVISSINYVTSTKGKQPKISNGDVVSKATVLDGVSNKPEKPKSMII